MTVPQFSAVVVVPSIEVDDLLVRCVTECRRVAPLTPVIVVVDDDSGADRLEGLAEVMVSADPGIAAKRNLGVRSTESRHVAFIDSDAYPDDGWIDAAVEALDHDPGLGAVGGPNVSPPDEHGWEHAVGRAHRSILVDGWWRFRKDPDARAREVVALPSCNLIVRRADYEALDGMNEELFTAEDTDFCTRLVAAGRRILFTPDVLVFHKDRGLTAFVVQRYTFGVAMVPLLRRGAMPDPAYVAVSGALAGFVVFVASAPVALTSRRWRRLWLPVTGAYSAVVLGEAARLSPTVRSVPRVALMLAVGNLAPGVGLILRALGLSPELRGRYRNDR